MLGTDRRQGSCQTGDQAACPPCCWPPGFPPRYELPAQTITALCLSLRALPMGEGVVNVCGSAGKRSMALQHCSGRRRRAQHAWHCSGRVTRSCAAPPLQTRVLHCRSELRKPICRSAAPPGHPRPPITKPSSSRNSDSMEGDPDEYMEDFKPPQGGAPVLFGAIRPGDNARAGRRRRRQRVLQRSSSCACHCYLTMAVLTVSGALQCKPALQQETFSGRRPTQRCWICQR